VPRYETLIVEDLPDGVVRVTLNRPEHRNAVSRLMHLELTDLLFCFREQSDVGAVVLTGAGNAFCAGGDFALMEEFQRDDWRRTVRMLDEGVTLVREFLSLRPPLVAAVNGHAYGLGATLVLLSDLVVMSAEARLADTHVLAGLVAGDGGTLLWPQALGHARAKEFLLTGDPVDAATALGLGLVNRVVPPADVEPTAVELATRLSTGSRDAIAWTKQAINAALLREAAQHMPLALALEARSMTLPDHREGISAFRERRTPQWPGITTEPVVDGDVRPHATAP
jgi:enoyl-CoA hydratase